MISGFKEVSRNKEGMKKKKNKNEQMMKKDGRWSQGNWRVESLTERFRKAKTGETAHPGRKHSCTLCQIDSVVLGKFKF